MRPRTLPASRLRARPRLRVGPRLAARGPTVGRKLIRESFTTEVILDADAHTIVVHYLDGPFSFLENRWRFLSLTPRSCEVDFCIAYSFRSRLLERLMGGLFDKAVRKYADAFETRANAVYGASPASPASQQ